MRKELTEKRDKAKQAARKLRAETASEALKGNLEMPVDPGYIPAPPPSPYFGVLSDELQTALGERIERGEQTILFLNRRGFSPFLLCRDCGFTFKCENCDVTLTYHRGSRILQCHHCNFQRLAPDSCPTCGSVRISPYGVGTEKVEDAVKDIFPAARTIRMDRDTTAHKGAHAFILRAFRAHEADVLIGTQMIAKGLDFPKVTLVGVINADTGLNAPDFRASEHSFQLLTQVSGRAGRGETPGEVIIQTFDPDNECIALASHHDYNNFFAQEIEHRRELKYPPFSRIATAIATGDTDSDAQSRSKRFADLINSQIPKLADNSRVQILGPAPCVVPRIKNRYRWRLMLRGSSRRSIALALRSALALLPPSDKMAITIDIDPANT
jgi:primosomal protein N' (replication factor Y)